MDRSYLEPSIPPEPLFENTGCLPSIIKILDIYIFLIQYSLINFFFKQGVKSLGDVVVTAIRNVVFKNPQECICIYCIPFLPKAL